MSAQQPSQTLEFQKALQAFKDRADLSPKEEEQFQLTTLEQLQKAIQAIQNHHASERKMQYMKRLQVFVDSMDQYGKAIEVFTNAADMVAFIWGPMKMLLQITSNFSEAFSSLLDAYLEIGESMPQMLQYQQLFHESPHMRKVLTLMYSDLLEFHREALKYFRGKVWKQVFQATWRGFTSKIKCIVENMRRHNHLLESQANIVQFEEIIRLRDLAEAEYQDTGRRERDRQRSFVTKWLSSASWQVIQEKGNEARSLCPGSGCWLLKDPRFVNWIHPKSCSTPLLWMTGIPGAGKTVLASLIIEKAQELADTTVAYFYCSYEDTERNSFLALARAILSQILVQAHGDDLLLYMYEKSSRSGETALSSPKLAKELLETALEKCDKTYLIIDGLDECGREERKTISHFFRGAVESLPKTEADRIRCLFVSQDDGAARKDMKDLAKLVLTPDNNKGDIEAFSLVWQEKIKGKFPELDLTTYKVAEDITSASDGMFLFAKLVTSHLHDQTSLKDLEKDLEQEKFPKTLDDLYERILERIRDTTSDAQFEKAEMLLGWIVCAKRPLKWHEIQGAVSIDFEESTVDYRGKLYDGPKDLCASLVERRSDQSMELVHKTARKYLIESKVVQLHEVNFDLASRCLRYLSFPFLDLAVIDDEDREQDIEDALLDGYYAFLDYAVVFWVSHFEDGLPTSAGEGCQPSVLNETLQVFLETHLTGSTVKIPVSNKMHGKLSPFKPTHFYESLAQAFLFAKKQMGPFGKAPSDDDTLDLHRIVFRVRGVMERLGSPTNQHIHEATLTKFYGPLWFKCPRMNCKSFDGGFKTLPEREEHIARHERAFVCSFEGCHYADMGFAKSNELDRHLSAEHHLDIDGELEFPETPKPQKKQHGAIPCPECGEMFTRKYNMETHRQKHKSITRVKCHLCDKAFNKVSDRDRHLRTHSGEKEHECVGLLKNGETWGCRRKFARADKLKQHYQSETGRRCMQPKYDEQAREQEEKERKEQERIRAEEAVKELERIKEEERIALEQAKQAETEESRELARKYAKAMEREWQRIQAEEEARKQAQADLEEQRRSHVPVHIPDIEVSSPPATEGSTPLPPFSSLTRSISGNESDD